MTIIKIFKQNDAEAEVILRLEKKEGSNKTYLVAVDAVGEPVSSGYIASIDPSGVFTFYSSSKVPGIAKDTNGEVKIVHL